MASAKKRTMPAQESDLREEFLDIAGHELRTPITALKGHVQLLQRRLRKQEGRESDLIELGKMLYQIERINHQLDVYLGTSHILRGKYTVTLAESDLVAAVRRVVAVYDTGITGHTIELSADDDEIVGMWDRRRIEEAVSALLANAVKFSLGGEIRVQVSHTGETARVEIRDRGVGVPPRERHKIFGPYVHGSNVENAGAGLGLHLAREAVRRQGGKIGVRAQPGGGSVFWFTLPFVPASRSTSTTQRARPSGRKSVPAAAG